MADDFGKARIRNFQVLICEIMTPLQICFVSGTIRSLALHACSLQNPLVASVDCNASSVIFRIRICHRHVDPARAGLRQEERAELPNETLSLQMRGLEAPNEKMEKLRFRWLLLISMRQGCSEYFKLFLSGNHMPTASVSFSIEQCPRPLLVG